MATCALSYSVTDGLSSVALKMASVAARGSMGSAHRKEGKMALAASKPTAIALDEYPWIKEAS